MHPVLCLFFSNRHHLEVLKQDSCLFGKLNNTDTGRLCLLYAILKFSSAVLPAIVDQYWDRSKKLPTHRTQDSLEERLPKGEGGGGWPSRNGGGVSSHCGNGCPQALDGGLGTPHLVILSSHLLSSRQSLQSFLRFTPLPG